MKTKTNQQITRINLVDGLFTYEEAKDLVLSLIQSKIHFHELNNFSSIEQLGQPDAIAKHRIPELLAEREKVLRIMQEAARKRCVVKIASSVSIELIDEGR
ncbi:MAG: hypothetical protein KatS3mg032_2401 [Cyclobacteriaceae bacterium]|nr:MAG: hypothetical protein KatS3mg032_2401 [Cyclobacteriaceae bacterium]